MRIRHVTTYDYNRAVKLNAHRLMLRPRDGMNVRIRDWAIRTEPASIMSWSTDVYGNAVAIATFNDVAGRLLIASDTQVDITSPQWPVFDIAAVATNYPFHYSDDDWLDLGSLTTPYFIDPDQRLARWARAFVAGNPTNTLALLKDLSFGIPHSFGYQTREDEGTQSPLETIDRGWGACRDFAVLFVEAARVLGFGARLVSGYLHDPEARSLGGSTTHAWADVFIPGAGWVAFDPTNARIGGANLVAVAVGRNIRQVMPVSGSFIGLTGSFQGMKVDVSVSE